MITNVTIQTGQQRDPRCPFCGRPVIGMAIYGQEGAYHPACTQPPSPLALLFPQWEPPSDPGFGQPRITCLAGA